MSIIISKVIMQAIICITMHLYTISRVNTIFMLAVLYSLFYCCLVVEAISQVSCTVQKALEYQTLHYRCFFLFSSAFLYETT